MKAVKMIKFFTKIVVLFAVAVYVEAKNPKVDSTGNKTLLIRFLRNGEFFQTGGPLLIYVGGREPLSPSNIGKGSQIYSMAKKHHGYLYHTEHRFYGDSTPNEGMRDEYLKYLNTRQAMSDLERFIRLMKNSNETKTSKVILVGCSSGGALATWFKKLHPQLVNGVWASSATLLAKTDLSEAVALAGETIRQVGGDDCYNRIKGGIADLENMFEIKRGADIISMFNLCGSFNETNPLDVSTLVFEISEIFYELVVNHKVDEIQKECTKLVEGSVIDLLGLAYYTAGKLSGGECNDLSYNSNLNYLRNPSAYRDILRQWTYQRCDELGWFKTSNSSSQIFGTRLPLDYFVSVCASLFGNKFTKEYIESKVKKTNKNFGGLNPNVKNVYWTNGELDPYRLLSIQNGSHATVIPNLSHCGDLHEATPEDSPELKASREKLEAFVAEWLA